MKTLQSETEEMRRLGAELAAKGVRYVAGLYVDSLGRGKSKLVPIEHFAHMVAGSEHYTPRGVGLLGEMTPHEEECVGMPDVSTLRILPWDPTIAVMNADLIWKDGDGIWPYCPRTTLKRQLDAAAEMGFRFNLGVETELYVFKDVPGAGVSAPLAPIAASVDQFPTPAYDIEPTLDSLPFLDPMVKMMEALGFGVYSFDCEGGVGQYEFDFTYDDALAMADKLVVFRLMAKQVAKSLGAFATFMPKPESTAWGSGHHFNMSLVSLEDGENIFVDDGDVRGMGFSKHCYAFIAGIMRHARALAAITNPTVNSYKRLVPRLHDGSVSWAPVWAAYGDNNRSCMLRLPRNRPCLENRGVDSAANTYYAAAFMLAAGLEGIREGMDPGDPVGDLTYDWSHRDDAVRLPTTLLEATEAFVADPLSAQVFPQRFIDDFAKMQFDEWNEYHAQVSEWERARYLRLF